MKITFKHIVIHNFLSFGDAEIQLSDRGYCVVRGINNCPKDSALSNGSGKSSIWSAICYALTGETIQGLKTDIVNIYSNNGCYVKLTFCIDNDEYIVTRYKDDAERGTDLTIFINGEDKSGKGIRESQALLEQYIPDLTSELIGSVIILGQGLPHKFSAYSPSGRKDLLEKLSKSNFMIEDIKNRIAIRSEKLNQDMRTVEDNILVINSQNDILEQQLTQAKQEYETLSAPVNFDEDITKQNIILANLEKELSANNISLKTIETNIEEEQNKINLTQSKLNETISKLNEDERIKSSDIQSIISDTTVKKNTLSAEIDRLKSIKDVCPTCGQKIPGIVKQDTTKQEKELLHLNSVIQDNTNELNIVKSKFNEQRMTERIACDESLKLVRDALTTLNETKHNLSSVISTITTQISSAKIELNTLILQRQNHTDKLNSAKKSIEDITKKIDDATKLKVESINSKNIIQQHIDVVNKMNTLVKRDFRGFLLSSVINFINVKAKEYCKEVFGTEEFEFAVNGNNIDISYCNKAMENLSGGEKQRVDLILQFAIRDMMSQYLDFSSNILVLDEIFDNLDILGTTNVLNLISRKLTDIESVFIISHNDSLEIPYDDEITVIKDEKGISRIK